MPQASQLPKQFSLVTSSLDLVSSNTKGGTLKFSCNAGADLEILGQSTQGATFTVPMCITTVGKQQLTLTIVLAYSNGREPALPDMPLPISYKQKLDLTLSSVAYTYAGSTYNLNMSAGVIGANCPNCPAVSLSPASSLSNPIQLNSGDLQQIVYIIPSNGTQLSYALTSTSMGGVNGQSWFSVAPASDFGLTGSLTQAGAVPVTITVVKNNLAPNGPYTGSVTVYTPDSDGVPYPQTIYVAYTNLPTLEVNPSSPLTFSYSPGIPPGNTTLKVTSSNSAITYSIAATTTSGGDWLVVTPSTPPGQTPQPETVSILASVLGGLATGTYSGVVTFTCASSTPCANKSVSVPVTLNVSAALGSSPTTMSFPYTLGGPLPIAPQNATVTSNGGAIPFTATASGAAWLKVGPPTSTATAGGATEQVSIDSTQIPTSPGSYMGTVTFTCTTPTFCTNTTSPTVSVTLVVSAAPTLTVSPSTLMTFASTPGSPQPANQTLQVTSSSSSTPITFSASATTASGGSWLQVSALSGTTPLTETISISSSALAIMATGTYSGTITLRCLPSTSCANSPVTISVTLTVTGTLSASPTSLTFYYTPGGTQPASQAVTFSSNNGAISYTAGTPSANWLQVSPTSGVTQQVETFSINTSNVPTAPNTYSASVVFTCASTSSCTSPTTTVNVTLNVTAQPSLISTSLQTFNSCSGSVTPSNQTLQVTSSGAALNYTAAFTPITGGAWLTVSPSSGTTAGIETVTIVNSVAGALTAGTYTGSVVLACNPSNSCSNSPVTVTATLIVSQAAFTVSPLTLNFNGQQDGANPPPQPVTVTSSCPISFTAKAASTEGWLSVSPTSANTPQTLSVSANIGSLAPNKYTDGTITISATGATSPPPVTVNLTVAPILLTATPPSLNFSWALGTAAPPSQTTTIGTNGASLSFTTGSCAPWMTVSPLSAGSTPTPLSVSIVTANVPLPGALTCNMMVTAAAGNSPFAVPVNLNVTPPGDVTISGQLSGLTGSFADITVLLTGSQNMSTTTTASGSYSFVVPPGGNYVVNPYQSEYSFVPQHQSFTNLAGNETASFTRVVPSDFNADGWPDIVWQSPTAGSSQVWLMTQGTTLIGTVPLSITAPIVGVGDFNGDGNPDIVTQSSGGTQITFLGPGGTTVLGTANVAGITGRVAAVADLIATAIPIS